MRSGEAWLTFFVAIIAFGSVIGSIHSANWVSEMPSLVVAGGIGLVTGWLLGNLRGRALPLHLLGVGSGLFFAVALALRSMELEDELLRSGLRAPTLGTKDTFVSPTCDCDGWIFCGGSVA